MDWTPILTALIALLGAVLNSLLVFVWKKYVGPWLEARNLTEDAQRIVAAVESIVGRHNGDEKWAMALKKMQEKGWNIDTDAVQDALSAAWKLLDLKQIMSGEKDAPYEGE